MTLKLVPARGTTAYLSACVSLRAARVFLADTAMGAVEAGFTALATEGVARIRDWLFQLGFAARVATTMADWV
jgi:hypothetical protein